MNEIEINEREYISVAKHAIGLGYKNPYTRHGRKFYKPYRNYFGAAANSKDYKLWESLESAGYAKSMSQSIPTYGKCFYLTRSGLDWLGEKIGVHIYDEE